MQYRDLLGRAWSKVDKKDRKQALREAYKAGREAAEVGLVSRGGSDLLYFLSEKDLVSFFFHYLIYDPDFCEELIFEGDFDYWFGRPASDPRIPPFCKGWRSFMENELEEELLRVCSKA